MLRRSNASRKGRSSSKTLSVPIAVATTLHSSTHTNTKRNIVWSWSKVTWTGKRHTENLRNPRRRNEENWGPIMTVGNLGAFLHFQFAFVVVVVSTLVPKTGGQSLNPRDIYKLISCLCGCLKVMIQIRNSWVHEEDQNYWTHIDENKRKGQTYILLHISKFVSFFSNCFCKLNEKREDQLHHSHTCRHHTGSILCQEAFEVSHSFLSLLFRALPSYQFWLVFFLKESQPWFFSHT